MTTSALFLTAVFTLFGVLISFGASAYLDIETLLARAFARPRGEANR